jgi:hypothetical protein
MLMVQMEAGTHTLTILIRQEMMDNYRRVKQVPPDG